MAFRALRYPCRPDMGTVFRPARAADAAELAGLSEELGYPASAAELELRLAHLLTDDDHAVFVAEDGAILGWVHVQRFLSLASDPVGLVTGLVVTEPARRQGIGRELMQRVETWARARGLESIRLRSRVERSGAHAFYTRLGYAVAKQQLQFRKDLG